MGRLVYGSNTVVSLVLLYRYNFPLKRALFYRSSFFALPNHFALHLPPTTTPTLTRHYEPIDTCVPCFGLTVCLLLGDELLVLCNLVEIETRDREREREREELLIGSWLLLLFDDNRCSSVVARSMVTRMYSVEIPKDLPFAPEEFTAEELELVEHCPVPEPYDAKLHFFNIKKYRAIRRYAPHHPLSSTSSPISHSAHLHCPHCRCCMCRSCC
jgi:hypothetical protein